VTHHYPDGDACSVEHRSAGFVWRPKGHPSGIVAARVTQLTEAGMPPDGDVHVTLTTVDEAHTPFYGGVPFEVEIDLD